MQEQGLVQVETITENILLLMQMLQSTGLSSSFPMIRTCTCARDISIPCGFNPGKEGHEENQKFVNLNTIHNIDQLQNMSFLQDVQLRYSQHVDLFKDSFNSLWSVWWYIQTFDLFKTENSKYKSSP